MAIIKALQNVIDNDQKSLLHVLPLILNHLTSYLWQSSEIFIHFQLSPVTLRVGYELIQHDISWHKSLTFIQCQTSFNLYVWVCVLNTCKVHYVNAQNIQFKNCVVVDCNVGFIVSIDLASCPCSIIPHVKVQWPTSSSSIASASGYEFVYCNTCKVHSVSVQKISI